MKLKQVLVAVIGGLAVSIAGCGGNSASTSDSGGSPVPTRSKAGDGPVTLSFMTFNAAMKDAAALWNARHPDVQVKVEEVPAGIKGGYDKMRAAAKAGNPPDVAQLEYQVIPSFLVDGSLADISSYLPADAADRFVAWTWAQVSLAGGPAAVPLDQGPMGLLYNKKLLDKHKIAVPSTWAEFEQAARALRKADPKAYLTTFDPTDATWLAGLAWQNKAKWFETSGDAWKVSVDDSATKEVLEFWERLVKEDLVKVEPVYTPAWNADLQKGVVASWITAVWGTGTLASAAPGGSGQWSVAPMPQWRAGEKAAGNYGGSSAAVFKDSKHQKEAAEFAYWLATGAEPQELFIEKQGAYPAALSAQGLKVLEQPSKYYGTNFFPLFAEAGAHVDTTFRWGPTMIQAFNRIADAVSDATNKKGSLVAAISAAQQQIVHDIEAQGLTVG